MLKLQAKTKVLEPKLSLKSSGLNHCFVKPYDLRPNCILLTLEIPSMPLLCSA